MKVFIFSNGCVPNLLEGKKISSFLNDMKYKIIDNYKTADIIIFNSCGFSSPKIEESYGLLKKYIQYKKRNAEIILTGCLNKIYTENLIKFNGKLQILDISELTKHFKSEASLDNLFVSGNITNDLLETTRKDIYNIITSTGCLGKCSYCAIKKARGSIRSKSENDIIEEINEGIKRGFNKYILWGDDLGSYGADINTNYVHLLKSIIKNFNFSEIKLYLHRLNPQWLIKYHKDFLELIKTNKISLIYSPIQSGSNRILRLMKRNYLKENVIKIFNSIKNILPSITIKTDIMIGFPSERSEDFLATLDIIREALIDDISVFKYGGIPGTPAFNMKNKVDEEIINRRVLQLWKEYPNLRFVLKSDNGKFKLIDKGTADKYGFCSTFGPINPDYYL